MAYTLTYSTGVLPVPDGQIATLANIELPGRNFSGYGLPVDQSMLSLTENFASSEDTGPTQPIQGQIWYHANTATLKYNTSKVIAAPNWASVPVMSNTSNVTFGNASFSGNVTVGNITVAGNLSAITGTFDTVNANNFNGGNLSGNGSGLYSLVGANVIGTVANATYATTAGSVLGTVDVANYVSQPNQSNITSVGTLTSLTVSGLANLQGTVQTTNITAGSNITPGTLTGNWILSTGSRLETGVLQTTNITTGSIGTAGQITGNWTLSGGSRLLATYADLAERHHSDREYPIGTVMTVGGINEVTAAQAGDKVLGVVSKEYAYLMNSEAGDDITHPAIAYVGRVPVRVIGPINKHDRLVPTIGGCAKAGNTDESFGWALETNTDDAEKMVLCIIK